MTPFQAGELALRLKQLFPKTNETQLERWVDLFERYQEYSSALEVLHAYYETRTEMNPPALLAMLNARFSNAAQIRAAELQHDLDRWRQIDAEQAAVAALSDEQRAEAVAAVLTTFPWLRKHKGSTDPRKNPVLRGLVFNWLKNPQPWFGATTRPSNPEKSILSQPHANTTPCRKDA